MPLCVYVSGTVLSCDRTRGWRSRPCGKSESFFALATLQRWCPVAFATCVSIACCGAVCIERGHRSKTSFILCTAGNIVPCSLIVESSLSLPKGEKLTFSILNSNSMFNETFILLFRCGVCEGSAETSHLSLVLLGEVPMRHRVGGYLLHQRTGQANSHKRPNLRAKAKCSFYLFL